MTSPCELQALEAPPDWSRCVEDIHCPLCEYNLRGLSEPRCPECGYRFTWDELTDPARRLHPYLFEHHPERNWWSFWKTALGGWRPFRFWTELHPGQRIDCKRLPLYWMWSMTALGCACGIQYAAAASVLQRNMLGFRAALLTVLSSQLIVFLTILLAVLKMSRL